MISKEILAQWFDLSKKIGKHDLQLTLDKMSLYAFKGGLSLESREVKQELRKMRNAVKLHNEQFNNGVLLEHRARLKK